MDGLFFLTSVIGIGVVMWWVMQNDQVPPTRLTSGMFGMTPGSKMLKRRHLRSWAAPAEPKTPARKRKLPF